MWAEEGSQTSRNTVKNMHKHGHTHITNNCGFNSTSRSSVDWIGWSRSRFVPALKVAVWNGIPRAHCSSVLPSVVGHCLYCYVKGRKEEREKESAKNAGSVSSVLFCVYSTNLVRRDGIEHTWILLNRFQITLSPSFHSKEWIVQMDVGRHPFGWQP